MECDALDRQFAVTQAHDHAIRRLCRNLEGRRQGFPLHDQRVIPRRRERAGQSGEDAVAAVIDLGRLAVKHHRRPHDGSAERRTYRLVSEAHAEDRDLSRKLLDERDTNPRLGRRARSGGDDDPVELSAPRPDLIDCDHVIPDDVHLRAKLREELVEVVGERIVVVDQQNHRAPSELSIDSASSIARTSARILWKLSAYSPSGVLSRTMPPPACKEATPSLWT